MVGGLRVKQELHPGNHESSVRVALCMGTHGLLEQDSALFPAIIVGMAHGNGTQTMIKTALGLPRKVLWLILTLFLFMGLWVETLDRMSQPQVITIFWPVCVLFLPVLFIADLLLAAGFRIWCRAPRPTSTYILCGFYAALVLVISVGYWGHGILGRLAE